MTVCRPAGVLLVISFFVLLVISFFTISKAVVYFRPLMVCVSVSAFRLKRSAGSARSALRSSETVHATPPGVFKEKLLSSGACGPQRGSGSSTRVEIVPSG